MDTELCKVRGGLPLRGRRRFETILRASQEICGLSSFPGILSVVLLPRVEMTEMNALHLHHEGATDVITYDLRGEHPESHEAEEVVAELYICPEVALEYARAHGLSPSRELVLYAVHGMLHLSGQDDLTDAERVEMRRKESEALSALERRGLRLEGFLDDVSGGGGE
ncbi:MAG: rRNA maturation RNase YbeY [Oligosphaeraceae bacterium]